MDKEAAKIALEGEYLAYLSFVEECGDDFGEKERQRIEWFISEYGKNLDEEDKKSLIKQYGKEG